MTDRIRVGDTIYSWYSQGFKVNGAPYSGVLSIDSEESKTPKLVYGAKRDGTALGMTTGRYEPKPCTIKMLSDSAQILLNTLGVQGLGSYGDATNIVISVEVFEISIGPITPILWLISGCRLINVKDSSAEGADELATELTFQPMSYMRNGVRFASIARAALL